MKLPDYTIKEPHELPDEQLDAEDKFQKDNKRELDLIYSKINGPALPKKYKIVLEGLYLPVSEDQMFQDLKKEGIVVPLYGEEDQSPDFSGIENEALEFLSKETGIEVKVLKELLPHLLY